ncbi:uncharacterized protein LOC122050384 [Zingiber officinale]|uniref:uncharacterized protein LOC122050384 n=1 Tax=Zingiber officinale TaxID=94328 RepID=UPI001C4AFA58|nr:uncharacterized protein LOC122050384 [Zingiber officinale]
MPLMAVCSTSVPFPVPHCHHFCSQAVPSGLCSGISDGIGSSSSVYSDRQKSYADRRRRPLEFSVGDHVFLRVSPTKGVKRFGLRGKLAPRYIGPFEILERIGAVAYRLALPPSLSGVHDVFHVSMLRRYVPDPTHVLADIPVPVQPDITYEEVPVQILDRKERQLRNKTIRLVKVGWQHHSDEEATWELEDTIRARYPHVAHHCNTAAPPYYWSKFREAERHAQGLHIDEFNYADGVFKIVITRQLNGKGGHVDTVLYYENDCTCGK